MSMLRVFESRAAAKCIDKLQRHILEKYEFWRSVAHIAGPEGLRHFPGFKDHALKGEWQGHRSSSLNNSYRVIYRIERDTISIYVIDVNNHDYRRK